MYPPKIGAENMGFFTNKRRKRWRLPQEQPSKAEQQDVRESEVSDQASDKANDPVVNKQTIEQIHPHSREHSSGQGVQGILDALVANICVVDSEGVIIAVNQAWTHFADENNYQLELTEFTETVFGIGRNYFTVCNAASGEDRIIAQGAAQGLKEVLSGERDRFTMEYPCHSPDIHRWFLLSISPIAAPSGGAIISHFNITEQTELRQANQTLDAFAQSLALAFRAPLEMMRKNLNATLSPDSAAAELEAKLHHLTENIDQLDSMVQDLLAYGRIGRSNVFLRPVDLEQSVQEALSHHTAEIRRKNAHISIAKSFPYVLADPVLLTEALSSLISNSLKFVQAGTEPEISIYAENRPEAVWVWLEDRGIGIDPKDLSSIFTIFRRGEAAGLYPGNGIGLAIVNRSIAQMKSFIEVISREGGGTRFKLIFPKQTGKARSR